MTGGERPGPIASLRALPSWTAAAGLLAAIVFFSLYGSGLSSDEAAALWPAMHEPWNLHALAAYPSKMLAPLWPAALALVFKVIPDTLTFARLVSFVCAVWSLALVARLVEESWDRFRGGIAAALVAVQPAFVLGAARAAPLSASLALLLWMIRDWRKQRARPADQPPSRSFVARGLLLDLAWWPGLAVLLFVAADGHRRTTDVTVRRAWVRAGIVWTVPWVALLWGFHFLANRYPSLGEFWFFSGADLPAWPAYWPLWVPALGLIAAFVSWERRPAQLAAVVAFSFAAALPAYHGLRARHADPGWEFLAENIMHRVPPDGTVLVLDPDLLPATAMALASGGILPRVTAEGFYYRPIVMDEDDMAARHWLVGPRPVDKLPAADRLGVVTNLDGNAGPIDKRFVMLARKQAPSARAELRIYAPRGADDEREETIPPPPPPGTSSGESVLPPPPETPPPIGKGEG